MNSNQMSTVNDISKWSGSDNVYVQDKFYIHFDTSKELEEFSKKYKYGIGCKCCSNTGAFMPGVKSKKELDKIKDDFLKNR
tara:strand:- start:471 stop:713 length:243 start_codon:yes stop_codon:yes gene_type:complete